MVNTEPVNVLRVVIGLNQGGVQQGVLNLCRSVPAERFRLIACAIENGGAIAKEIEQLGVEVIILGFKRQPWKTIRALVRVMREKNIHILHASSYHPSLYARIAAIIAGVPVRISYEHVVFDNRRPVRIFLNRILAGSTHAFTAVGEAVAAQVRDWYSYDKKKVRVIHNGVDVDRFKPVLDRDAAKISLGLDPHRPVVSLVSRLDEEKGHRFLFEAAKKVALSWDVQWLVVGTGRGEAAIKEQAKKNGVDGLITFLGMRRDVPEILSATDIFAFPTLQEGFPNSLIEAMSSGCAVIASDFPGNLEVAKNGHNALIVPMGDSSKLADAILALLSEPRLAQRLSKQARLDIKEEFSLEAYARKMTGLYQALLEQRGS